MAQDGGEVGVHHGRMATPPERQAAGSVPSAVASTSGASLGRDEVRPAVGAAADPAEIRAIAFAASLGPQRPPHSSGHDLVIDLAGEEALVEFLMRITPVDVND
jgi:hypothetical protein